MQQWNDAQPIFLQIRQRIIDMILRQEVAEGGPLPSVRQVAAELSVNPLTITRAFEGLVDSGAVESRRGLGMFVAEGARAKLLADERQKFLNEEWPRIRARISSLGFDPEQLIKDIEL